MDRAARVEPVLDASTMGEGLANATSELWLDTFAAGMEWTPQSATWVRTPGSTRALAAAPRDPRSLVSVLLPR